MPFRLQARITPKMTGNNTPAPYVVISSASWLTTPWQAFDGIKDVTSIAHTNYGVVSNIDIGIDLASARRVSKVKVYSRNGAGNPILAQDTPKEIIIRSSADGINWKVEKTIGNIPAPTEDFAMIIDVDVDFTARYVGLILNNPTNNRGYTAISEIELYGYNDPTSTPAPASVLLTPAMTGNNAPAPYVVFESGNAGWPAWQAFNQNTTHWESANVFDSYGSGHAYIGIDLGSAKTLTKYTIRSRADQLAYQQFMRDFTVQGSNDGIIWTTLDTVVDYPQITNIGHVLQRSIGNTTAFRYYKIDVTKNYANPRVVIDEIGLYGY